MEINTILFYFATLFYFFSAVFLLVYFSKFKLGNLSIARKFLIAGFLLHIFSFFIRWYASGYFPVTTLFESFSFFAMVIAFFQIIIDFKYKIKGVSLFSTILLVIISIIACMLPNKITQLPPVLNSFWLPVHVFFAFLGNGIFAISFGVSILYLIQVKKAKSKILTESFFKLPPLETIDLLNYRCLTIGFPLLTIGIITGSLWAASAWGAYWSWDPKETWSLITWFLYAALLHGRINSGWRGKKGAIFSIIGFCVVLFTFIGVNLLLPGLHSYAAR